MEMAMIKSEDISGRAPEARPLKRRIRDTAASLLRNDQETGPTSTPTTVKRSSRFRGVSRHRWTGRYEAHLWDKLSWNVTQEKKGIQIYLGAYDDEETAARAYDLAALKYWGTSTLTNFPISDYEKEIEIMLTITKEECLASLRSGFSRGQSKYRGVARCRHHHNGRWEARIGRVLGNKYPYLGTYSTQEEAARAYDIAAIEYRGINADTNFDLSNYIRWLKPAANSNSVPAQDTKPSYHAAGNLQPSASLPTKGVRIGSQLSGSSRKSSSPTALGLLLRSSVFRELVEQNSNLSEEESDDEKYLKKGGTINDEYGGFLYDIPFVFSSNSHGIELQWQFH